jgi:RNA polymerase sigma-70 factor, ECF subfamily
MFDLSFDEIAPIVERTPAAARQLASRARRRIQGTDRVPEADLASQRPIVEAFLTAARSGDLEGLMAVLDPDVEFRIDPNLRRADRPAEARGAAAIAKSFLGSAQAARAALVNGAVGAIVAPKGRLLLVLGFTFANGRITSIDAIGEPERLDTLTLAVLDH